MSTVTAPVNTEDLWAGLLIAAGLSGIIVIVSLLVAFSIAVAGGAA